MDTTSTGILKRVLRLNLKTMSPSTAREILTWKFHRDAKRHLSKLLEMNREGTISTTDREELRALVLFGELVNLLQAKAELILKKAKTKK